MSLLALRVSECQRKCKCINNPEVISRYTAISYPEDSGYEIGYTVELAKGLRGSVTSRIFYIYFTILGVKKIVRYIENQKREAENQKSAQRLLQTHDSEQRVLFFKHNNIFCCPYQPSSGVQMLLNLCRNHNII